LNSWRKLWDFVDLQMMMKGAVQGWLCIRQKVVIV
jgi:hypothetical protein